MKTKQQNFYEVYSPNGLGNGIFILASNLKEAKKILRKMPETIVSPYYYVRRCYKSLEDEK